MDPNLNFLEQLLSMINDLTYVAYAAPLIVLLVGLLKRIPLDFIQETPAGAMHLAAQVAFWVLYRVIDQSGGGAQLQQWTEAAALIIKTLLPLFVSVLAGAKVYQVARENRVPLWGYQRPSIFDDAAKEGADPRINGAGGR